MVTMRSRRLVTSADAALLRALASDPRRQHLLVVCNRVPLSSVVQEVLEFCASPCHFCVMPGQMDLPPTKRGTVLVIDVAAMTIDQQIRLHDWLGNGCGNLQVVAIASRSLKPLVEEGRFLEGLFYRLNVVQLDAAAARLGGRLN